MSVQFSEDIWRSFSIRRRCWVTGFTLQSATRLPCHLAGIRKREPENVIAPISGARIWILLPAFMFNRACHGLGKDVWLEKYCSGAEFFSFCAGSATLNDFVPARAEPQLCAISIHQCEGQEAGALWSLFLFNMSKDKSVQAAKINKGPGPAHSLHSHKKKMPSLPFTEWLSCFLELKKKNNN